MRRCLLKYPTFGLAVFRAPFSYLISISPSILFSLKMDAQFVLADRAEKGISSSASSTVLGSPTGSLTPYYSNTSVATLKQSGPISVLPKLDSYVIPKQPKSGEKAAAPAAAIKGSRLVQLQLFFNTYRCVSFARAQ